jgi:hypothetical protein
MFERLNHYATYTKGGGGKNYNQKPEDIRKAKTTNAGQN